MKSHATIIVLMLAVVVFGHNNVRAAVLIDDTRMSVEMKSQIVNLKEATVLSINNYLAAVLDSNAESLCIDQMKSATLSAQALKEQLFLLGLNDSPYYVVLEQILNAADLSRVATLKFQIAQETSPVESTPVPVN